MTSLTSKRLALEATGKPIQVGLIGAGKFGSMFISQAHRTPGLRLAGIADLSKDRAFAALKRTGYPEERVDWDGTMGIEEGIEKGKTVVTTDSKELIACGRVDVVLEVTGSPAAGVKHALMVGLLCPCPTKWLSCARTELTGTQCCEYKTHIVMVNVEADVLAGPLLARRAKEAGIIYSMAYGDQPALICELVDWARTAGL